MQDVVAKALSLYELLALLKGAPHPSDSQVKVTNEIARLITEADSIATHEVPFLSWRRLADWWFGGRVEDAWMNLHEAELLLTGEAVEGRVLQTMMENAFSHASRLSADDPVRQRLEDEGHRYLPGRIGSTTISSPLPATSPQVSMQAVLQRSFQQSDAYHRAARAFRNRLVITIIVTLVVAVSLVIIQWRLPTAKIIPLPAGTTDLSRWAVMLLVIVFGTLGALITTIPSMAAIPRVSGPYNFPLQQSFVKMFVGSLSALVGVVVIGNTGVASGFASLQSLLGVAIVFGAGQQAVTQFLDKRAGEIIASAP